MFENACLGMYTWFMEHTTSPRATRCKSLLDQKRTGDLFCESFPRRLRPGLRGMGEPLERGNVSWEGVAWVHDVWVDTHHLGHWAYRLMSFWSAMNRNQSQSPPIDYMLFRRQNAHLL